MAKENIEFALDQASGLYVAEFTAEEAFRLHIEGEGGVITIQQKDQEGDKYDIVHVWPNKSTLDTSIADPNEIYPVDIKITCSFDPVQAFYRVKE